MKMVFTWEVILVTKIGNHGLSKVSENEIEARLKIPDKIKDINNESE